MSNLTLRILSALVLAPLALAAVWAGGFFYAFFIIATILVGVHEWLDMTGAGAFPPEERRALYGGMAGALLGVFVGGPLLGAGLALALWLVVWGAALKKKASFWVSWGIPYLACGGVALLALRADPEAGLAKTLYLLLVVWGTDIGAYAAGVTIGGPKIWPQISPKKTWAGLFGGMVLAMLLGSGARALCGQPFLWTYAGLAAILAVVAQAGDFFESFVKRTHGVKDSGTLIPGHGGILDRIDGVLFAAIFMALVAG